MIGFSPKGILEAVTIFPIMLLIALCLDIISLILMLFGLDDLGILDIIGFTIFGIWIFTRSGGERTVTPESSPDLTIKGRQQAIQKKGVSFMKKLGKVGARAGIIGIIEFIPYVGAILFGWTFLVIFEAISDLRNFSLETGE
ncbi:MAG: hypothetical protein HYT19_01210 [Candidatus Nealsonbacteria bacterium]|nr:hypothetical protein [Candidatus Nealsonbacteria bacterium]